MDATSANAGLSTSGLSADDMEREMPAALDRAGAVPITPVPLD